MAGQAIWIRSRKQDMQQNTESSLEHVMARRGERVLLTWQRAHVVTLAAPHEPDQEDEQPATVG